MSELVLTKTSPSIILNKSDSNITDGEVVIRTEWDATPAGIDLDLGVMWKSYRDKKGVIQALGKHFGSRAKLPYLRLDGDDRLGGTGETIRGSYAEMLKHLEWFGVYLYIYSGAGSLVAVQGARTTVTMPGFRPVVVKHQDQQGRTTAILQCINTGNGFEIKRDSVAFQSDQSAADHYWGFGLKWRTASK